MTGDYAARLTERYNREARVYRELWAPVLRVAGLGLLETLRTPEPLSVLDVATGVGSLLPDIRQTFPRASVAGVDRSHGMLQLAPTEYPRAVMDARFLGIASGSIDLVLFNFMLFHLEEPLDALSEARRVLRAQGRVGTLTWGQETPSEAMRIWTECMDSRGAEPVPADYVARLARVDAPAKMETMLKEAGFDVVEVRQSERTATFEMEDLIRMRTQMGASMTRFDSLAPDAQADCIAEARQRMKQLEVGAFVAHWKVVSAVGKL